MATGGCFPLVLHISDSSLASAAMWIKERANKGLGLDDNPAHEMSRGALGSAGPNIFEQFSTQQQHLQQQLLQQQHHQPADVEPR